METKIINLSPGELTFQSGNSVVGTHVGRHTLICMMSEQHTAAGMILSTAQSNLSLDFDLEKLIAKVGESIGKIEPSQWTFKAIGPKHLLDHSAQFLASKGFDLKTAHLTAPENIEAFLFVQQVRLRIREIGPTTAASTERGKRKRVLIVDDSRTMRELLQRILSVDPDLEVVGLADRPSQVEDMIKSLKPDVLTMDIDMPECDGPTLIGRLLPKYPIPIVLISALGMEQGRQVLRGLELGAVDYVQKPVLDKLDEASVVIREKVKIAADIKIKTRAGSDAKPKVAPKPFRHSAAIEKVIIAIGASTGGPETLTHFFKGLPENIPPILVVQHIPPIFSGAFAARLDGMLPFQVKEAEDHDEVKPNQVLIAPGGKQMAVLKKGAQFYVRIRDDQPMSGHKPSVDYLFESVAQAAGEFAIGIIMTGMGTDGAKGLLSMLQKGARTIAQDEASSIVYGMPKAAVQNGSAQIICSLDQMPETLAELLGGGLGTKRRAG
jgi:two-component system, chemotaxis family, protein-glutamate methylesterase/glutaminase